MTTWVISIIIAMVFLAILIGVCVSDKFANIFGTIFTLGLIITALTLAMHGLFFE